MSHIANVTTVAIALSTATLCVPSALIAQDVKLPPTLTFTAYDTGSSGFNIAVAVGKSLKDKNGSDVRVLPAGNDVARLNPLRTDRAQASAMGIGGYFAQESVRRQGLGAAAAKAYSVGHRLQRHLSRRRQGYRRQGDQGPAGQARRHSRGVTSTQSECLRGPCLWQPDPKRRKAR